MLSGNYALTSQGTKEGRDHAPWWGQCCVCVFCIIFPTLSVFAKREREIGGVWCCSSFFLPHVLIKKQL
jgi:hypothetical protein